MVNDPNASESAADEERIVERSALSAEEREAGSDDPAAQAAAILADSDEREAEREAHPMSAGERRHSEDLVDPDALVG
jgi:hypothetical protein